MKINLPIIKLTSLFLSLALLSVSPMLLALEQFTDHLRKP